MFTIMDTIKDFRKSNKISQIDLAAYLGVTQGFVSQIEKGICPIPDWVISKILENPFDWDVSMLEEDRKPKIVADQIPQLSNVEILLRDLLAEKEAKIDALNEMIWELKAENARLQEQLRSKGGVVAGAEDSLSASA